MKSGWRGAVLAAAMGVTLAAGGEAQMTGGQANAAQALAMQTRQPQAAAPAGAVRPAQVSAAGRRDPFRPLVVKGKGDELPARLPPGKAGLVIGQLTLQGIVRGINGEWIAVVDNKTKRAYFLYVGDELYNGVVTRITAEAVMFDERVTDAAGRPRTREVTKRLAPG
ncbi:MAG TPA: hypothetical protein VIC04_00395 [Terriglobia bacterium]